MMLFLHFHFINGTHDSIFSREEGREQHRRACYKTCDIVEELDISCVRIIINRYRDIFLFVLVTFERIVHMKGS